MNITKRYELEDKSITIKKGLASSRLGDKLNHLPVTFNKKHHQNVFYTKLLNV